MKFLVPAAWTLGVLALPILLFYLLRQRLRIKPVTTLLFWDDLTPKIHQLPLWRKLRRLVSLLLQLILLGLIFLALARPLLPGQASAASSLVLILDPSVTMAAKADGGTRWDAALETARHRIDAMTFGDEAAVILADDPPRVLSPWTGRKGDLRTLLATAARGTTVTDIQPALLLAQNLVLNRPGASIELISDTVWTVAPDPETMRNVRLDRISGLTVNSGITLFAARPLPAGAGDYQLAIRLEQNTVEPIHGELTVTQNGQLMDVLQVTIPPGEPWQKFWHGQSLEASSFEATWKPQGDDAFAPDGQAATRLDTVHHLAVTLVSPPNPFLEVALGSQPEVKMRRVWPVSSADDGADLTFFNGVVPPDEWRGKAMVLINPPQGGFWGERLGPIDQPLVSEMDKDAGLMRFVDVRDVQLRHAVEFKPAAGAHVYVDAFGKPLIFGHWESEPRWIVIAFDLDQSDFVFRTAFPILCANLVQTLRPDAATDTANVPGPVATRLKPLAGGSTAAMVKPSIHHGWAVIPLWWWIALDAALLLLLEWSLYSRRVTE